MREIKFEYMVNDINRGWCKEIFPLFDIQRGYAEKWLVNNRFSFSKTHGIIKRQYTGLTDKNGVEIYEGDILAHELYGTKKAYSNCAFVMGWNEERAAWTDYSPRLSFEIIGNIHENPELLQEPKT